MPSFECTLDELHLPAVRPLIVTQHILAHMLVCCSEMGMVERAFSRGLQANKNNQFHFKSDPGVHIWQTSACRALALYLTMKEYSIENTKRF
jgi:hypothetical protein